MRNLKLKILPCFLWLFSLTFFFLLEISKWNIPKTLVYSNSTQWQRSNDKENFKHHWCGKNDWNKWWEGFGPCWYKRSWSKYIPFYKGRDNNEIVGKPQHLVLFPFLYISGTTQGIQVKWDWSFYIAPFFDIHWLRIYSERLQILPVIKNWEEKEKWVNRYNSPRIAAWDEIIIPTCLKWDSNSYLCQKTWIKISFMFNYRYINYKFFDPWYFSYIEC